MAKLSCPRVFAGNFGITHVSIFTENGSRRFVSELEFEGGAIGWRQYTARGFKFTNCITSIQMILDWGFNWQDIKISGGTVVLNISSRGNLTREGIGSILLIDLPISIDSSISNVPIGILTRAASDALNIAIDNIIFTSVEL
ncbi:hypothetical protein N0V88_001468 [Collariella sp. IMI 366227]|nr:hypothetical protein N0V88_001468 [Collariella sp. IMI 366227]